MVKMARKRPVFFFVLFSICLRIDSLNEKQLVARSPDGNKQCFYTITWKHLCIDCQFRLIQKNGVIAIKKNRKMSLFTFLVYDFINNDIVKKSINNTFDTCFFGFSSFFLFNMLFFVRQFTIQNTFLNNTLYVL